ncbi:MAG: flagellar assembly protein FliW [Acidobacteriota bacterium]|jgi:flagellar assembly factor FliW|nr:MAG: hypothetical protein DIU54_11435 [Acidobacteriota bacterium]
MSDSLPVDGIVTFAEGLPGFESQRAFVVVASSEMAPFTILRGVGADGPSFVTIDPRLVDPAYPTTLDRVDLARLKAAGDEPLLWLAIIAAREDGSFTANLRAPVVINPGAMCGIQIVAVESPYRVDHPLPMV